ncbi:MAG: hypothetical protein QOD77_569 [Thermoplasmata archaeon]|jgi:hypothetical protein|nr:hypothetical protein [Thermoplasmata archaeon]
MQVRLLALAAAFVAATFAGCVQPDDNLPVGTPDATVSLLAGPALWNDPQNAPHAKWGWATLSNPPAGEMPRWWQPFNGTALPEHVTGLAHVVQAPGVEQGAGIALFGSVAVVPDDAAKAYFVDISQPADPKVLGTLESSGRGAAIIAYPDGRLVAVSATTAGFDVMEFTDPTAPEMLSQVEVPTQGGHKLGVVPGTPIVYNAGSQGGDPIAPLYSPGPCNIDISQCVGYTEIYNLTDPSNPVLVQNFQNGLSCHHVFFWNAPDGSKSRAVCAGLQYTQLWDTADPEHPTVLVSLPVHHGTPGTPSAMVSIADFSHSAGLNAAGDVLYVGDESGGGAIPPGCVAGADTPVGATGTPIGATWFYDVSDEANPQLLGYYTPLNDPRIKDPQTSCTTHHGRLVPEEGRDLLAMSYYGSGVILVDFTGIGAGTLPTSVAQFADGSNTWETWYAGGYLFTGDLSRGMDVLRLT